MAVYVVLATAIAITAAVVSAGGSFANAVRLATTHQPEVFTELYFLNPGQLPAYAAPGKKQTVRFHIQSHAAQRQTYSYRIAIEGLPANSVSTGSVVLSPGTGATVPFNFTIAGAGQSVSITIRLVGTQQYLTLRSRS
jgi:hypothetical protein